MIVRTFTPACMNLPKLLKKRIQKISAYKCEDKYVVSTLKSEYVEMYFKPVSFYTCLPLFLLYSMYITIYVVIFVLLFFAKKLLLNTVQPDSIIYNFLFIVYFVPYLQYIPQVNIQKVGEVFVCLVSQPDILYSIYSFRV